jgi:hypothetical protein
MGIGDKIERERHYLPAALRSDHQAEGHHRMNDVPCPDVNKINSCPFLQRPFFPPLQRYPDYYYSLTLHNA